MLGQWLQGLWSSELGGGGWGGDNHLKWSMRPRCGHNTQTACFFLLWTQN